MTRMNDMGEFSCEDPQPWEMYVDPPRNDAAYAKRTCRVCGRDFEPHTSNERYCCDECREARRVESYTRYNERRSEERRKRRERNRNR